MLRTVFTIGLFAVLGLIALKLVFGVLPALIGLFMWLAWQALVILCIGFVIYLVIRKGRIRRVREQHRQPARHLVETIDRAARNRHHRSQKRQPLGRGRHQKSGAGEVRQ